MKRQFTKLTMIVALFGLMMTGCEKPDPSDPNNNNGGNGGGNGGSTQLEAVDLDLPSGTKWASANLGANSPEEYGDYFAWGEVTPYYEAGNANNPQWKADKSSGYHWLSYKYCVYDANEEEGYMTKYSGDDGQAYGTPDGKTVLEAEDDAATVILGGAWRMPTLEEFQELQDYCSWEESELNGVSGYKVTSRRNGNSIFIPNAGQYYETELQLRGEAGYFWTSTRSDYCSGANSGSNSGMRYGEERHYGFSIRPVCR